MTAPAPILLPVEVQSREFDAKLVLACVAAERGHTVFLGCRTRLHRAAHRLPPSVYLGKGLTRRALKSFDAMGRLGHTVAAWDEEGLVYMTPEMYRRRKLAPATLARPDVLFAWGEDNAEIWRGSDGYRGQPIVVSGNARADLMRPELRAYHAGAADRLRERFGRFVLINSSFGGVNHWVPAMSGSTETSGVELPPELLGTTRDPAMNAHRRRLFEAFLAMLGPLADALGPSRAIVVRPHPSESPDAWQAAAAGRGSIHVLHEGPIIPWLLAAEAVVHNGCQTGVEAFLLDRPAVAYQPFVHPLYEMDLPNMLSVRAATFDQLVEALHAPEALRPSRDDARTRIMRRYVAGMDGPFASERIVAALTEIAPAGRPPFAGRLREEVATRMRAMRRRLGVSAGQRNGHERYLAHIFPDLPTAEVEARIARLGDATGRFAGVRVHALGENVFEIAA
ncbi:MAG: surface carbohydrate biosynthesis protein [Alphaproteobacteria bacterium]